MQYILVTLGNANTKVHYYALVCKVVLFTSPQPIFVMSILVCILPRPT